MKSNSPLISPSKSNFLLLSAMLVGTACSPAEQEASGIRVMTFNIRYGTANEPDDRDEWPQRSARVEAVVREFAPDIVGVQEALRFQIDSLRSWFPIYAESGVGRDDGREAGEYSAILYRSDRFEVLAESTEWLSATPDVPGSATWGNEIPRIVTWARLRDRQSERTFYVYNTHWDHQSQPSRERSAFFLLHHIAARDHADPVLVMGDFNAGEDNRAFRQLIGAPASAHAPADAGSEGVGLTDTFRTMYPDSVTVGTFNGFEGDVAGPKIDAILTSPGWLVRGAGIVRDRIGGRYPSDHYPVVTRLLLSR